MHRRRESKKLTVLLSAVMAVIMLAASGIYAWFSSEKQYIEGQIDIGTMEVGIHVFKYDGSLQELDGDDSNPSHTGQSTALAEGVIVHENWNGNSAGVRYIAIENNGTIDVKSYLTLQGLLGPAMNENSLDYFHFLITPLSELSGSNYVSLLTGYAQGYTQTSAADIVADSSSFRLTNIYKSTKIGEIDHDSVSYYRLDYCCYNMPTDYVPQQASGEHYVKINASVAVRQKNAPEPGADEGGSGNNTYVDSAAAFVEAIRAAANNDTIFLMQDITVDDSITILQRVNINLNGHSLTVTGNLAYDSASAGYCQLVITGSSRLYVWGDLLIDMPNTRFELLGSGSINEYSASTASIILGHYTPSTGTVQGGRFYVNCMRDPNHIEYGYTQTAAQVWKWINEASCTLAVMEVGSDTGVKISSNSVTGVIRADSGAHDIAVYNYGEIMQIDLSAMNTSGGGHEQIYIVNYNKFTNMGTGENAAVIMPSWAIGHVTGAQSTPVRDYNARAINGAGAVTGWHVSSRTGEGYTDASSGYFRDQDIESGFAGGDQVIRNGQGDYTVVLINENDSVEALLAAWFAVNSGYASEWADMSRLTIVTYESGAVKPADFTYIRTHLTKLAYLDLGYAIILGGQIPSGAMQGVSSLTELVLPMSEISIGDHAFDGTSIEFLTISNNVTSIGTAAFSVAQGKNIYITWDSTVPVDSTILQGFAMDRTIIFMYEYLLDDFRTNYASYAYHAYEHYDFFDAGTNGFYKILSGGNAQLIYYRGALNNGTAIPVPSAVTDGDTTYSVTTLGDHCYRLSIQQSGGAVMTLSMPTSVKNVEDGAFYGVKLSRLALNNVTSIGREAFAYSTFAYSEERPTSFTGMTHVGEYAFGNAVMGDGASGNIDAGVIASKPESGTLDLSGGYTPSDNAFNNFKIWRGTLKLNGLTSISSAATGGMVFYGSTLYIDDCDTIYDNAFNAKFFDKGITYNKLYARNVKFMGGGAFAAANLSEAYIGIAADMYADQGAVTGSCQYGVVQGAASVSVFGTNSTVTILNISGWLPESATSDNTNALLGGNKNNYGTVNINYAGAKLPDYLFYLSSGVCTIGQLNISSNVLEIGAFAFNNCTINNTTLDMSLMTGLGESAFQKAKLPNLTAIELADGAEIGANCFNNANLSSITSIDLENISFIGTRAFYQINGGGITSINVYGVESIGAQAFADIKNNTGCTVAEIDITQARSVGASAFGGLNITLVKIGNTAYYNDGGEYTYGATLFASLQNDNTIGELRIMGNLPTVRQMLSVPNNPKLLTYNSVVVTSACSGIPDNCFTVNDGQASYDSGTMKGVMINSFTSEGNIAIGQYVFRNNAFGGNMDFSKVTSIAQHGFRQIHAMPNTAWSFDSLTELTASSTYAFSQITGGPLTLTFTSLLKLQSVGCFQNSTGIKKIVFGSQLYIMNGANLFDGAANLTSLYINGNYPPTIASSTFGGVIPQPGHGQEPGLTIYVPADVLASYNSGVWATYYAAGYFMDMGSAMTSGDYSFRAVTDNGLTWAVIQSYNGNAGGTLSIPSTLTADGVTYTVTELAGGAFEGGMFSTVNIPASVRYIDPAAFTASSVTTINIDSGNPNYSSANGVLYNKNGSILIYYCGAKTDASFTVPNTVTIIASNAFMDATRLNTLNIGSSVTTIDGSAFSGGCAVTTYNFNSATPPALLSGNIFGTLRTAEIDGSVVYYGPRGDISINIPAGSFMDYAGGLNWHPYIQVLNETSDLSGDIVSAEVLRKGSFGYEINDEGCAVITAYYGAGGMVMIPEAFIAANGIETPVIAVAPTAFNGVRVTAFAVSDGNEYFSVDEHGVLYSADGKTLVRYPAASEETGYEVPERVTRIEAYAFAGAENLETVFIPSAALMNMGEQVFEGCSDKLALYAGAADNPFAAEIPEAILPEEQGKNEDGEGSDEGSDAGAPDTGDGNDGETGDGEHEGGSAHRR